MHTLNYSYTQKKLPYRKYLWNIDLKTYFWFFIFSTVSKNIFLHLIKIRLKQILNFSTQLCLLCFSKVLEKMIEKLTFHRRQSNRRESRVRKTRSQFYEYVYDPTRERQSGKNVTPWSPLCVSALRRLPCVGWLSEKVVPE